MLNRRGDKQHQKMWNSHEQFEAFYSAFGFERLSERAEISSVFQDQDLARVSIISDKTTRPTARRKHFWVRFVNINIYMVSGQTSRGQGTRPIERPGVTLF